MWGFDRAHHLDEKLRRFHHDAVRLLGAHLRSLIVFGSKASGEFDARRSNINLLLVLTDVNRNALERLAAPMRTWDRLRQPAPILIEVDELASYAKALPIEFLDLKDHHRVLHGEDPLVDLRVDQAHLRAQCVYEIATKQLRLRQALALAAGRSDEIHRLLADSLPSVLTVLRAVHRLIDNTTGLKKLDAADRLGARIGFDSQPLHQIDRARSASDSVLAVDGYLAALEKVEEFLRVDQH